jgi:hypothetical protein
LFLTAKLRIARLLTPFCSTSLRNQGGSVQF